MHSISLGMPATGFLKRVKRTVKPFALPVLNFVRRVHGGMESLYYAPGRNRRRLTTPDRERVTLFLAPEAGLEPFFASHALLARVLADAGHKTILLSCNGLLPSCSTKLANQVNHTRPNDTSNPICVRCRAVARRVGQEYGLVDFPVESLLTNEIRQEIERVVALHIGAPWEARYDGIEIGRACLGEALRTQRKLSIDELTDEDRSFIAALLYSSLAVYLAVKILAARFDIARIAYMGDYAYFIAPQLFARANNIPLTNISHAYNRDIDRRFLNLRSGHAYSDMMAQVDGWPSHRNTPIPPGALEQIGDGGLYRFHGFGGASTYSPNWKQDSGNVLEELGLPAGGTVLVAYSNSTDELLCNREILRAMDIHYGETRNPFETQVEWLLALAKWVGERPGLRLVIRLHPRMAKGHRHPAESSEAALLRRELAVVPSNVVVVWPESKMSSYNIAEHATVALTAWSSIGLELARFGIPIVSAFQRVGPWPNSGFNAFSETRDGYFEAIERALKQPPGLKGILDAFRWTYRLHWTPLIDISDVTPDPDFPSVPPYRIPKRKEKMLRVFAEGADLISLNTDKLPNTPHAALAEREALQNFLGRALGYILSGNADIKFSGFRIEGATPQPVTVGMPHKGDPVFEVGEEGNIAIVLGNERYRRHSPLAVRLARCIALG